MNDSLALYIHWPFCASKCPYCDFNSHVRENVDHRAWKDAYLKELSYYAGLTPGRTVQTIFFGGGTPSLMHPDTVAAVLQAARALWPMAADAEITMEANPTSIEADKFRDFRAAGVNRVSVGVQALNDEALKFLGREHTAAEARRAVDIARASFDRTSFDLMYARPEQSPQHWAAELGEALTLSPDHISLYQLTIEEGTPFHTRHARGDFEMPGEDAAGDFYEVTQELMVRAGLPAYEISNHARPGQESRHNLVYWRYGDYVGVGPGAHGRLTLVDGKWATRAHRAPEIWLEKVMKDGQGGHECELVAPAQRWMEALMMGLRLQEGVPLARLETEAGQAWNELLDKRKVDILVKERLLNANGGILTATPAGRQRLNGLLGYLM